MEGCEEGPCLTDEASNDDVDDKKDKSKKASSGSKADKLAQKALKARPIAPAIPPQQLYSLQTAGFPPAGPGHTPAMGSVVQSIPKSPQLKAIQPKPSILGEPLPVNPTLSASKDKKKIGRAHV